MLFVQANPNKATVVQHASEWTDGPNPTQGDNISERVRRERKRPAVSQPLGMQRYRATRMMLLSSWSKDSKVTRVRCTAEETFE
jgi:hypothetical protein